MLDRISEEELAAVLVFLDVGCLREAPSVCRGAMSTSSRHESALWRRPLQRALAAKQTAVDEAGQPIALPDLDASRLSAKQEFRIRTYMTCRQLPSLCDALRRAADCEHGAMVRLLLGARADPNAAADSGAHGVGFTQVGAFPLHLAAKRSCLGVLDTLLAAAADVDAADQNGRTGLMVASASGQAPATEWLLSHGAAVNTSSHYGYTALHYAALLPRAEIIDLLLRASASPALLDREGQTPLHVALQSVKRRVEVRQEMSCDPSGYGDEYCYNLDTSHGYNHNPDQEAEHDAVVKRAVRSLLHHGADARCRDSRGRDAFDILEAKRRPDLRLWLKLQRTVLEGEQVARGPIHVAVEVAAARSTSPSSSEEAEEAPRKVPAGRRDPLAWALGHLQLCCSLA